MLDRMALWRTIRVTAVTTVAAITAFGVATLSGCAAPSPTAAPTGSTEPAASPTAASPTAAAPTASQAPDPTPTARDAELSSLLDSAAPSGSVDYAVALVNNRTGEAYAYHGDELFATASIVKVDILATLLRQQSGTLTASQTILAQAMIRESDNDAASTLWGEIGGVDGLNATDAAVGLTDTTPGTDGWWGYTTTTVADQVKLVDAVSDPAGLLGAASATVTGLMGTVVSSQSWGISAAARAGESVILKNGWMTRADQGGRWTVNSIGRITGTDADVTIAVMSEGNASDSAGIAFVEKLAKLTRDTLV